jgi:nicotinamidase-related amidase
MAVTKLDPKTALIVIDLQKGILRFPTAHPADQVVKHARQAIDAFRRHHLPIVLVNVAGMPAGRTNAQRPNLADFPPDWAELVPELNRQPEDHVVTKRTWGAFTNTDLDEHLKKLGVTQVVILGVATSIGVESTARHAHENGFNVTLAVDAMTDMNADAHTNSITRIFPRLGETGTTQEIIDLLNTRA